MLADARDARRRTRLTSDLRPPEAGLNADPVLYGVAAGLAALFPPVASRAPAAADPRDPAADDRSRDRAGIR